MSRHIIDHPKQGESEARARAFIKIERREKPSDASRQLQKASRGERTSRMQQYVRIEKGQTA